MPTLNTLPALFKIFVPSFGLILLLTNCDTISFAPKTQAPVKILQYRQLCGNIPCPSFQFSVFSDGTLHYQGEAYTPLMGLYGRKLPETEWQFVRQAIAAANLWAVPENYPAPDANLAISEITVFDQQFEKRIIGQQFPPEIHSLENLLLQLSDPGQPNWQNLKEFSFEIPAGKYNSMFKVQLQPNINVDYWIAKYYDAGMDHVKALPNIANAWLIRFDPSRMPPNQLKMSLESDRDVISVEYVDRPQFSK